ncbi:MAG: GAF domain-containing protein, partial [Chloroflexota bacterium]
MIHKDIIETSKNPRNRRLDTDQLKRHPQEVEDFIRLHNLSLVVGASFNLKDSLWTLYLESSQLLDTTNFAIATYDKTTDTLEFVLIFDQGQKVPSFSLVCGEQPGLGYTVITTGESLLIQDLLHLDEATVEVDDLSPDQPVRSWLGAPMPSVGNGRGAEGLILVWSYEPHTFDDSNQWVLSIIAAQAAVAIRHVRLFESLQQLAMEMAVINDVAHTLASTLNLREVLTAITDQVEGMLNVEAGFLLLKDSATNDLVFQIALGSSANQIQSFRIPIGQGIAGQVLDTGVPQMLTEITPDQRELLDIKILRHMTVRNLICVPLIVREYIIGVLEIFNHKEDNFTQRDFDLLQAIVSYAAIAIENARLHHSVLTERDRVIQAEEQARRELARNLHDGPTQLVSDISSRLDFTQRALEKEPELVSQELADIQGIADRAIHQMRTMLFELRPLVLETEGIVAAIEVFLQRRQSKAVKPRLALKQKTYHPDGKIARKEERVEAAIFAIVQEAVNNALKHAKAKNVFVQLTETPKALYVVVVDDGVGFDVKKVLGSYSKRLSLGMVNIQERAEL